MRVSRLCRESHHMRCCLCCFQSQILTFATLLSIETATAMAALVASDADVPKTHFQADTRRVAEARCTWIFASLQVHFTLASTRTTARWVRADGKLSPSFPYTIEEEHRPIAAAGIRTHPSRRLSARSDSLPRCSAPPRCSTSSQEW